MKVKGPLVTLAVGAVVAGGLLVANISFSQKQASTKAATVAAAAAPAAASAAPASAKPSAAAKPPTVAPVGKVTATYAGKVVHGGSLSVALKGATAIAYLCDGTNEAWLWGPSDGTDVALKNKDGGTLTGTRGGGKLTGSLTVNGKTWSFTLPSVKKPSGLYRATARIRGADVVGGWVVLSDGSQVGVVTADGGNAQSAPPIDLGTGRVTVDGQSLTATEPDAATLAG